VAHTSRTVILRIGKQELKEKREAENSAARILTRSQWENAMSAQQDPGKVPACEEVEHMADRAFRVFARSFPDLLENAAHAMVALDGQPPDTEYFIRRIIDVDGSDRETLLVNWLNEILYLEQTQQEFYDHFLLSNVTDNHLHAQLYGRQLSHSVTALKAVTFHNLKVKEYMGGLEATVVIDV
jgi:SHS2 domain-containing protein